MKITLRECPNKSGTITLYLEYYKGVKTVIDKKTGKEKTVADREFEYPENIPFNKINKKFIEGFKHFLIE